MKMCNMSEGNIRFKENEHFPEIYQIVLENEKLWIIVLSSTL